MDWIDYIKHFTVQELEKSILFQVTVHELSRFVRALVGHRSSFDGLILHHQHSLGTPTRSLVSSLFSDAAPKEFPSPTLRLSDMNRLARSFRFDRLGLHSPLQTGGRRSASVLTSGFYTSHRGNNLHQTRSIASSPLSVPHDIGGNQSNFGPIPDAEDLQAWEQQCHALFAVLASKRVLGTDGLRRAIEALTPAQYESWTYYEKWTAAMTALLLDDGVLKHDELSNALFGDEEEHSIIADAPPRFQTGDAVRVKPYQQGVEWRRPHLRTPGYVYGVAGTVERVYDRHPDPSFLAFGLEAPQVQLYRVRFQQKDLWPEQYDKDGDGGGDVVEVELYDHWLESSDESTGHSFDDSVSNLFDHKQGDDCVHHQHDDHDEHDGHHHDSDDDHHHVHEPRPLVEERAVAREGPARPGKQLFQALLKILLDKQIVTAKEIREMSERMDTAGVRLDGAQLIVQAWLDPEFRQRLLQDAPAAALELGISTANPNAPTVLTIVPNTSTTHNLIVCTLCSCYPSGMLGIAPSWYKSSEYRSRAVREPRAVLREFGLNLPQEKKVRVHDSTADHRYLVLPERPLGTEDWSEDKLKQLVSRDSMLGVAVPTL